MPGAGYANVLTTRVPPRRRSSISGALGRGTLSLLTVAVGLIGGLGWVYALRQEGWLKAGPRVGDALPLLQLASFDRQPLLRVVTAWLLSGLIAGFVLARLGRFRRLLAVAPTAVVLLWLESDASHALARNLRFGDVLTHRWPGPGTWLAAALFTLAAALPGRIPRPPRPLARGGDLGLRGGQWRHARQHQDDRHDVRRDGGSVTAQ